MNDDLNDEVTETEVHSEADKKTFIDELEQDFDPEVAKQKQEESQAQAEAEAAAEDIALNCAKDTALMVVGVAETGIQEMVDERLEIGEANADKFADAAAPLVLKYGVTPPEWLVKFKEEVMLGLSVATIGFSLWKQHRDFKKADMKARKAELEAQKLETVSA
ncbi:hypothetical protein VQ7734_00184 [Vibrio quintilis]|uniref:Uncharacterized protein n=2 Tax=Vibrio quintilis TaxID=1117707 RepID=A0A1M7YPB8_9VIBR|nr:hypothetical protein VQ7734_00184 [Vibrio quintilis]